MTTHPHKPEKSSFLSLQRRQKKTTPSMTVHISTSNHLPIATYNLALTQEAIDQ